MAGIKDSYERFVKHDPMGYDHPSLTTAFNDLAKSPFGRDILNYYKNELKGPLIVTDELAPGVLGETSYSEIAVRPHSNADTLAHEMRHAYQNHAMGILETVSYNPFFNHMQIRMVEADAFSFACLNAITRWKEAGYKDAVEIIANERIHVTENEAVQIMAFNTALQKDFDPAFMPRLMRKVFERYYGIIATSLPGNGLASYEARSIEHAVRVYQRMDKVLNPSTKQKVIRNGVTGLLATTSLCSIGFGYVEPTVLFVTALIGDGFFRGADNYVASRIANDFNNTTNMIDKLTEKLGVIPGMDGNYLTNPKDIKLSDAFYTHLMHPDLHAIHAEWSNKIQAGIDRRALSNAGPK